MPIDPNIVVAGGLLGAMAAEYGWGRALGRRVYGLADALSDIGTSLGQLVVQAMLGFTTVAMYAWLEARLGLVDFPTGSAWSWILGFVLVEFVLYWRHRAGHGMRVFWAIHEVHHQSSEYNLAVAQRVGYLQWLQTAVFVIPLAVLGMPTTMFVTLFAVIHGYQFLVHTRLVGRLGPLEAVLVTPSHHRVHHGRNHRYLDKNFGFTLIAFDHLFGTFQAEDEEPVYGTTRPLPSWSPIDNNVRPWVELWAAIRSAPSARTALAVPFRHPAWDPGSGRVCLPDAATCAAPRPVPSDGGTRPRRLAVVAAYAVALALSVALVQWIDVWGAPLRWAVGGAALALTASVGLLATEAR